ncbi:alpha-amylase family protein [Shouchella shacheensis]|uniref:alpha-amylase family protein n=1 Tax=Shouchella shacheensis TaxID=1649580 RepID=UPI00073FC1BB|nr:alpha-amylase family protein [Shouchella shacheensis]
MTKTILFYDETFPFNGTRPSKEALRRCDDFSIVGVEELVAALQAEGVTSFVHLHGPYFPKQAWNEILAYLQKGGGLVHAGGPPFKRPVYQKGEEWMIEKEQTAYHQQLNIHEALPVKKEPIETLQPNEDLPVLKEFESLFSVMDTYGLILHGTKHDDLPHENGSSGPMDAYIYPLLKGVSRDNREVAAPVVAIENTKGRFSGGRWVLINQALDSAFWTNGASVLDAMASYVAKGVTEIWIKPGYASYYPGEALTLSIQLQSLYLANKQIPSRHQTWMFSLVVRKEGEKVFEDAFKVDESREIHYERRTLPVHVEPGLYDIECSITSSDGETLTYRQGFWGFSQELLEEGAPLVAGRDYFEKEGRPYPIVGMTYMTSDVARKFLFMPNVAVWNRDMGQMSSAGINHIRTGIWTAWRQMMFIDGHPYEEVLRSIDAFLLTAKQYDIDLCFNFFGFTPETWEGNNPYLDPRSLEAQKRFIAAIVSRYKGATHIHWDLINEPSMFDPERIFKGPRSAQDPFERAAFQEWVKKKYSSIRDVQEAWNYTPDELPDFASIVPPEPEEIGFDIQDMRSPKKSLPWMDYTLFTMEIHNQWVEELSATIRSFNGEQLVTVGQDEALASQRPTPFFYGEKVDYTTNHTWWQMDHLVWDGVFTKTLAKPNLIQETGIMYLEQADGSAKRSEEELRNILERKYAYAFSTGGAGAAQWLWNTNFYMDNVNESNIGALRADGTEKPEANVSYDFGRFIEETRDLFSHRKLEEVAIVFPYSNDFSSRKLAYEATTRAVRTLAHEMNTHVRGLSEYHLEDLSLEPPKLIIVPSAHNFSDAAFDQLIAYAEQGGTVLYSGPIRLNESWAPSKRLPDLLAETTLSNVRREEGLIIDGAFYSASFGSRKMAQVSKEVILGEGTAHTNNLQEWSLGKGTLIWSPLPLELNDRLEVLRAVYEKCLQSSRVKEELVWSKGGALPGIYGRKLAFRSGNLFIFVSEYSMDAEIDVTDPDTGVSYAFVLACERSVLFATNTKGEVTTVYRPEDVQIRERERVIT